jgi:hypothetical protein
MICEYCKTAGELQKSRRSDPTPEVEKLIEELYEKCKGCACAKKIIWGNVVRPNA